MCGVYFPDILLVIVADGFAHLSEAVKFLRTHEKEDFDDDLFREWCQRGYGVLFAFIHFIIHAIISKD